MNSTGVRLKDWQLWHEANCCRCTRAHACALLAALASEINGVGIRLAMEVLPYKAPDDYLERAGMYRRDNGHIALGAHCPELQRREDFAADLLAGKMHPPKVPYDCS